MDSPKPPRGQSDPLGGGKRAPILTALVGALALVTGAFAFWTVYPTGVTVHEAGVAEGYVLFGAQDGNVYLIDVDGALVHTWSVPCGAQGPPRALANGHLLTGSCGSLVELDWAGTVVWEFVPQAGAVIHHDWERLPNGNTLILCRQTISDPSISEEDIVEDFILEVSSGGAIVWEWHEADHFAEFGFAQERIDMIYDRGGDWSHATSVSVIPANTSHSDPRFSPGNIIIGLRHQNTLAVIDRATNEIVWTQTDGVVGPHTAHMISDDLSGAGNILVLDSGHAEDWSILANRFASKVVELDPVTGSFPYMYEDRSSGLMEGTFFSHVDGGAQRLSNGNTLITEAIVGRIFEVSDSGQLVWEYVVPFSDVANSNATYRAYKVPLDWAGAYFVPDLVVSGDDDPDPVQAGDDLEYTIQVVNVGSDPAIHAELVEATPVGTTFQSISAPAAWDCSTPAVGGTGPIRCTNPSLGAHLTVVFTIVVKVDDLFAADASITNTATLSSDGSDATPGDNTTTISTTVSRRLSGSSGGAQRPGKHRR